MLSDFLYHDLEPEKLAALVFLMVIGFKAARVLRKRFNWRHRRFQRLAAQKLDELARLSSVPSQYYLLRSVNPFVFEEMVLTALQRAGHKIVRNKRYTGDGGIDGQVFINGQHYLIQSKRYRAHINAAHVEEFSALCKRRRKAGLFVHTGKTGAKSRAVVSSSNVEMISGQKMLSLLLNQPVSYDALKVKS